MRLPKLVRELPLFGPLYGKRATLSVYENPQTGQQYDFPIFRVDKPPVNIVFPVTAKLEVVVIKQYRHAADRIIYELPGGLTDGGESEQDAGRELLEETGYRAARVVPLLAEPIYFEPASLDFRFKLFLALECVAQEDQKLDANEYISIEVMPLVAWVNHITRGEYITDAKSMAATLLAWTQLRGAYDL